MWKSLLNLSKSLTLRSLRRDKNLESKVTIEYRDSSENSMW